jgi:hypothetical protein
VGWAGAGVSCAWSQRVSELQTTLEVSAGADRRRGGGSVHRRGAAASRPLLGGSKSLLTTVCVLLLSVWNVPDCWALLQF